MQKNEKIKVGVIGVGAMGSHHARIYHGLDQVELVGVVDPDLTRAKEKAALYNAPAYTDPHDLIGKVDAVSVVTPSITHAKVAEIF